eukprot:11850291-Alexandrium_andersonii.AAC.1
MVRARTSPAGQLRGNPRYRRAGEVSSASRASAHAAMPAPDRTPATNSSMETVGWRSGSLWP